MTNAFQYHLARIDYQIESSRATIEKWQDRLVRKDDNEPALAHAFEWSGDCFRSAAEHEIACWQKRALNELLNNPDDTKKKTPIEAAKIVHREMLNELYRNARSAEPRSTSATSNLTDACKLESIARAEEHLRGLIRNMLIDEVGDELDRALFVRLNTGGYQALLTDLAPGHSVLIERKDEMKESRRGTKPKMVTTYRVIVDGESHRGTPHEDQALNDGRDACVRLVVDHRYPQYAHI